MKKQILLVVAIALMSVSTLMAQSPGDRRPRQTPEERAKATMEKLATLKLNADAAQKTEAIFLEFFKQQRTAMQELRSAGTPDRNAAMEKRKKLADERDTKLKTVFTTDQYNKWKNEIEPSLRPQRVEDPAPPPPPPAPAQ